MSLSCFFFFTVIIQREGANAFSVRKHLLSLPLAQIQTYFQRMSVKNEPIKIH